MAKTDPAFCSHSALFGGYHLRQCSRKVSLTENGRGYCKQHAPSVEKARDDARQARWKRDEDVRDAHRAIQKAKYAIVAAAEAYVASKGISDSPDDAQLVECVRLLGVAEAKAKELGIVLT